MRVGSAVQFEAGLTRTPSVAHIDDDHIVVAYQDRGDSYKGKVVCASLSGLVPTFGAIVTFASGTVNLVSIDVLDSTHFVIAYIEEDAFTDDICKAIVGSVSGTTITLGSAVTCNSGDNRRPKVCGMDSTHFVVAFQDDDAAAVKVIGGSVSGTTITLGSSDTAYTASVDSLDICSLDSSHFVIVYDEEVACGTLSGNTVTIAEDSGTSYTTEVARSSHIAALDSSRFVVAFVEYAGGTGNGYVIAGSVSGTTISIVEDGATRFYSGPIYTGTANELDITDFTAGAFAIAFRNYDGFPQVGYVISGSVSGTTITVTEDDVTQFEADAINGYGIGVGGSSESCSVVYGSNGGEVVVFRPFISGVASISSVSSISLAGGARRGGAANISSSPLLSILGNFHTLGSVSISTIASLTALGGNRQIGSVSIASVSRMLVEWRKLGLCGIAASSALAITGERTASAVLGVDVTPSLTLVGMKTAKGVADIDVTCAVSVDGRRHRMGTVSISSTSAVSALGVAYFAQLMGYTGTLSDGDVLVIDCDEETVMLNGANATRYFTGSFPQLYSGTNELRWLSDETPDASFETKHEPRYL